jgi:hypothetical protein
MSYASKKRLGFRGALLAAGMMVSAASPAFANGSDNTRDKQKRVEIQKEIEKKKTVEIQKRSSSSGAPSYGGTGGSGQWGETRGCPGGGHDHDARKRYEERQRQLAQRAEANRERYEDRKKRLEERRKRLAERYEEQKHRHQGTGGSGYGHGYEQKYEGHPHHNQGTGGSGSREKYEDKKERLKEKYEDKKERLEEKYEDKNRR